VYVCSPLKRHLNFYYRTPTISSLHQDLIMCMYECLQLCIMYVCTWKKFVQLFLCRIVTVNISIFHYDRSCQIIESSESTNLVFESKSGSIVVLNRLAALAAQDQVCNVCTYVMYVMYVYMYILYLYCIYVCGYIGGMAIS
jgi:hypothetical protein